MDEPSPREQELLEQFGSRLHIAPDFNLTHATGIEVALVKEIWAELTDDEHRRILTRVKNDIAGGNRDILSEFPDPTPTAMRLTYAHLKDLAGQMPYELGSDLGEPN